MVLDELFYLIYVNKSFYGIILEKGLDCFFIILFVINEKRIDKR